MTSAGNELLSVATYETQKDYFIKFAKELKKKYDKSVHISLHDILSVNGEQYEIMQPDLLENS